VILRLRELREELNLTPGEMALKLNIDRTTYYKYEKGHLFCSTAALGHLYNDLGISLDWFFFGNGSKYRAEREQPAPPVEVVETKPHAVEEIMPDVKELLDYMVKDAELRHEVMRNFYVYKRNKESKPIDEIPATSGLNDN